MNLSDARVLLCRIQGTIGAQRSPRCLGAQLFGDALELAFLILQQVDLILLCSGQRTLGHVHPIAVPKTVDQLVIRSPYCDLPDASLAATHIERMSTKKMGNTGPDLT